MTPVPTDHATPFDQAQRRARLARRHRLAPEARAESVTEAATSLVCLHGTDPATIFLSARARVDDMMVADLERALYEERSLVKHLAMRRTLFVFPSESLPFVQAGASNRVADTERRRLIREVEKAGLFEDGAGWLGAAEDAVLDALEGSAPMAYTSLRDQIPLLKGSMTYGEGRSWGGQVSVGPRVLTVLSAEGRIVRATNDGPWRASRNRWATSESWLGMPIDRRTETEGASWLIEAWLRAFGPGTEADLKWWLGSTVSIVRKALSELDVVAVDLEGRTGYLMADDQEHDDPVEPWAALLPALDPTTMGWRDRDWYLGPHKDLLFDTSGNAGPTAWWDGRIVGGWWQDEAGQVVVHLLEDVGAEARCAFDDEAAKLTAWLEGEKVLPRFPSPLAKLRA
ncbi:winged helix DNA-binding protein [Rhodococcus sp. OK611]|uniref:winged helix DNA-binding domain-containing protein n=1 Tax=unclassified Rhodococcus (in: high G+C Gram-positive bacteria) TaxID=192944 RepID=UPI000BC8FE54|nr:winged helix DNA-binding protein [Rhodococcus sp. OK611]SNX93173.1 Winged helix DNA-binding domain-containing protein [Rhodococcus sp. OK270]